MSSYGAVWGRVQVGGEGSCGSERLKKKGGVGRMGGGVGTDQGTGKSMTPGQKETSFVRKPVF